MVIQIQVAQSGIRNDFTKVAKRKTFSGFVDGLNFTAIRASIQWKGMVHLRLCNEDSESMLSEHEFPKKSGIKWYACATTGLLFDKQSGACRQSSNVWLKLDTMTPTKCTPTQLDKWAKDKIESGPRDISLGKRGPKPKGYVAPEVECDEY